ncbi:hypothetical protein EJ110_NYTH43799 [Nymphaea thermarum]|nr:hypothetical protein EJ110_NYTH43799 [Nymphaea thermarum]
MEGAAVHLKDLPSRGLFSSPTVCSSMWTKSAERGLDRSSAKRANKANDSSSRCRGNDLEDLQSMTVERLRALLKAKGLSTKGKKDELVERLREHSERRKSAASKNKSGEEASRSKVSE